MKRDSVTLSRKVLSFLMTGILLFIAVPRTARAESSPPSLKTISPMGNIPPSVYQWLSLQQNSNTGLLPSQQNPNAVNGATVYNNALAIMIFTLEGDTAKAKKILDFFNSRANEFFDGRCNSFALSCSNNFPCNNLNYHCGFFQARKATSGAPDRTGDRWMGDMAWLLMAIHYYQIQTSSVSYTSMANAIIKLLVSFQQPEGYIAAGWAKGDQSFNSKGYAEGNLNAYKALLLYSKPEAQQIKGWLDFNNLDWRKGPLDLHSWRVLSLGKEYGYSLPDAERTDDDTVRYKSTIIYPYNNSTVRGFLPYTSYTYITLCRLNNNIWSEGTGQMAVSFYKAGYKGRGDFYISELEKLLFKPPAFPTTQTISYLALSSPLPNPLPPSKCPNYSWVDPKKGHVAAVSWYIFAKELFDPFDGVVINSFQKKNPVVKLEAESYNDLCTETTIVRCDATGKVSEGGGAHIGGDDAASNNNSGGVEYKFNVLTPITIASVKIRYADDVAGDIGKVFLDNKLIKSFSTVDTGTWSNYTLTNFPVVPRQIQPGLHILRVEVSDNGTYGFTVDYISIQF